MKVSLVSMIHKPPDDFKYWIDYHFSIGISDIYLRVEDTPELKELLDTYQGRVHPIYANNIDPYCPYPNINHNLF